MTELTPNRMSQRSLLMIGGLLLVMVMISCSDLRNPSDMPGTHPTSWIDPNSADFHGQAVYRNGTLGCKSCHGDDLDGGEVNVSCIDCHLSTGACSSCHGGGDNQTGAPPVSLRGATSPSSRGVGAHTIHLSGSALAGPIECEVCHVVPLSSLDSTHYDGFGSPGLTDSTAELTFSDFADGGGAAFDNLNATCQNIYCHGQFTGGHNDNDPVWTDTVAVCSSCHNAGDNLSDLNDTHAFHVVFGIECNNCHASVVTAERGIADPSLHVNGQVETEVLNEAYCSNCHGDGPEVCVYCHGGTDNMTGAPPIGLRGETATTSLAAGAHTAHLEGRLTSDGVACTECHINPTSVTDIGHYDTDSIAEIIWGPLAGVNGVWDRSARKCSDTYCHGNFPGGYNGSDPVWTGTAQGHCGSCHDYGLTPATLLGRHSKHVNAENLPCAACHFKTVDEYLTVIGPDLHVNGIFDVDFETGNPAVWNGYRCTNNACHQDANW